MSFFDNKNILITGATGLVGTHALLRFKEMPFAAVRAVYHQKEPLVHADNISYLKADLTDFEDCRRAAEGIDYLLMYAVRIVRRGRDLGYLITNLQINFQMLEAAYQAGVKKVIWLSSAVAYPPSETPLTEEQMFAADPHEIYFPIGWATRYTEILCRMYSEKLARKMPAIVLRPTAIYGEYCDFNLATCHVLPALIRKVVERQNPLEIWGTGQVKRDFVYAGDVVDACLLALEKINDFTALNIGLEKSYSVKELLETILELDSYSDAKVVYDPAKQVRIPSISVDCAKARQILGFEARTSIREGIARTMKWYRENNSSKKAAD